MAGSRGPKRGASVLQLLLGLLALILTVVAFAPFFFRGSPGDSPGDAPAAARLARSTVEELEALPVESPLLQVNRGDLSTTWPDLLSGDERPHGRFFREWTVEAVRFDRASGKWMTVRGGAQRDAVKVTIRVRVNNGDTDMAAPNGPVLATLAFYRYSFTSRGTP